MPPDGGNGRGLDQIGWCHWPEAHDGVDADAQALDTRLAAHQGGLLRDLKAGMASALLQRTSEVQAGLWPAFAAAARDVRPWVRLPRTPQSSAGDGWW